MPSLERQYRILLVTFPAAYREVHEDEIVTTLLDGAGNGQRRPTPREALSLLLAGMRIRAQRATRGGRTAVLGDGLRVGALLVLCSLIGVTFSDAMHGDVIWSLLRELLVPAWLAVGATALVRGSTRTALVILLMAASLGRSTFGIEPSQLLDGRIVWMILDTGWFHYLYLSLGVVALILAAYPALRRGRSPWPWWLAPVALTYSFLYGWYQTAWGGDGPLWLVQMAAPAAVLSAISVVTGDARPSLGGALYAGVHLLSGTLSVVSPWLASGVEAGGLGLSQLHPEPMLTPGVLVALAVAATALSQRRLSRG